MLKDKNQIKLAAYSIAFDPQQFYKESILYPLAPAFKKVTDFLIEEKS
jgi:hypothetical protein